MSTALLSWETYGFSFELSNPATAQRSPDVSVQGEIYHAGSLLTHINAAAMDKPGELFRGVHHGSDPLKVIVPQFVTRDIGQSTCLAGATNMLTIALKTNINLCSEHSASIFVTPLTGAKAETPVSLVPVTGGNNAPELFWNSKTQGHNNTGRWGCGSCAFESLYLDVRPGQTFLANVTYKFDAVVRNPRGNEWELPQDHAHLAPLTVGATGSFAPIAAVAMTIANDERDAVLNGSQPLKVLEPYFSVKGIRQHTTAQAGINTLTVTLQSPFPLKRNSSITLTGLKGAHGRQGAVLLQDVRGEDSAVNCTTWLSSCAAHFAASVAQLGASSGSDGEGFGFWNNTTKSLALYLRNGTSANEHIVFSFNVTNPAHGQAAATPSVEASLEYGKYDSSIAQSPMDSASGNLAPLLVNEVLAARCEQRNASATANNIITFTLATRASLATGSVVHLTGLNGSSSPSASLPLSGNGTRSFGNLSSWTNTNDVIRLTLQVSRPTSPGVHYCVRFRLNNSAVGQAAPPLTVSIESRAGIYQVAPSPVESAEGNAAPMLLARFVTLEISQSSSAADDDNKITVDFKANVDLISAPEAPGFLLITGLTDARVPALQDHRPATSATASTSGGILRLSGGQRGTDCSSMFSASNVVFEPGTASMDTSGNLTLFLTPVSKVSAGVLYSFSFHVTNPFRKTPAAAVSIAAHGPVWIASTRIPSPSSSDKAPLLVDRVAAPTMYPAMARTCVGSCVVSLRTATQGAKIFYSLNSTAPSNNSAVYTQQVETCCWRPAAVSRDTCMLGWQDPEKWLSQAVDF